mgnify:CR=1 FL=1
MPDTTENKTHVKDYTTVNGTSYDSRTAPAVRRILEKARRENTTLRIHYGDRITGESWLEECDVFGRISRSSGRIKVPVLIEASGDQMGGSALLDHCIIAIDELRPNGILRTIHLAPNFVTPKLIVIPLINTKYNEDGYTHEVLDNHGGTLARFKSSREAYQYCANITPCERSKAVINYN